MEQHKKILVVGASFAGLTTAYWMNRMGYKVTLVEISSGLKMGGTAVDIKDSTVDIVRRMGIYEQIKSNSTRPEKWEFKNAEDVTEHTMLLQEPGKYSATNEFEIERDYLLQLLHDLIKEEVTFIFSNSVTALSETTDAVEVTYKNGAVDHYHLVFGCDGIHSSIRKLWFGPETEYVHFLGQYFGIGIVKKLLVPEGTYQMYAEPHKGVALYAYHQKTDIIFTFRPPAEIAYDFRNQETQKQIIQEQFKDTRWRTPELLHELVSSNSFYFDKFCQVKIPSWTKGRVALVGDAGYCASPAAGMGGSLAIIGASALTDAIKKHDGDFVTAFAEYNAGLHPFIEDVQAAAVQMLDKLLPRNEEEVRYRLKHGIQ